MADLYPNGVNFNQTPLLPNPLLQEQNQFNQFEEEDEIDLRQIGRVIHRRWPWMLLVGLIVGGLVGWKLVKAPPIYKESFQLLIQPPNTDAGSNPLLGKLGQLSQLSGGGGGDVSYYETQIKVLTSNSLLLPLVNKLKQHKEFFKDEESRKKFSLEDFLKKLKVSQSKDTQIVEVTYQSKSPQEVKLVLDQLASIYLKYTINDQNFQSEQKLYFLDKQIPIIKQRILFLQKRLEAFRLKNDFIDPTNQGLIISDSWKELNKGKQENDAQLRDAIALYQGLKQQLGISQSEAIALNALNESPRYMALLAKLREIDTKLAGESTRFTDDSPKVRQLQEERKNLVPLIQQEATVALSGLAVKPEQILAGFVSPNTTRQTLTQQLLVAGNLVQQLQARQRSLNLSEQKIKTQVQNYARSAAGYAELAGQLEIETQGLASLLTARQALQIDAAKSFSPWRLVSEIRIPEKPESQLLRNLLLATLAGLVAGGGTGLLLESLDRNLHTSEDLAEHTGLTVLGTIPVLEGISRVKKMTNQKQLEELLSKTPTGWMAFLEAFSFLYTNLFFVGAKRTGKSIVITSATPGEGKSTTSFFLAQAAGRMGRKVLLVDGDRYFPQTDYWLKLAAISKNVNPQSPKSEFEPQSIQHEGMKSHCISGNFYIVQDSNFSPVQMMDDNVGFEVIEEWKHEFDIVIIDAPPILGLSDTKLIANKCDGVLLVCRMDKVDRDLIKETLLELKIANLKVIGAVANATSNANRHDSYYSNYYYSKSKQMLDQQG